MKVHVLDEAVKALVKRVQDLENLLQVVNTRSRDLWQLEYGLEKDFEGKVLIERGKGCK